MFAAENVSRLNDLEKTVYQYVVDNRYDIPNMKIRNLADQAHVSTTTVLRFCRKMGCDGFADFKEQLHAYEKNIEEPKAEDNLRFVLSLLNRMELGEFDTPLQEAAEAINQARLVLFYSIGNGVPICEYAARLFTSKNKLAMCVPDPFYPLQNCPTENTLMILLSVSGKTKETLRMAEIMNHNHIPVLTVTASPDSPIAHLSSIVLPYEILQNRGSDRLDYTSQIPAVAFVERLAGMIESAK